MNAPVPRRPFAWSHSALKNYETCPLKYYHQNIAKDVVDRTESDSGNYGQEVHAQIHRYIARGEAFDIGQRQYQPFVDAFLRQPGKTYAEQKLAMNREHCPAAWFDKDVWVRAQVDAAKHNNTHLDIVDWKFGRIDESWEDQSLIMAAVAFAQAKEVETVTTLFVWWKEARNGVPPVSHENYTRETLWQKWLTLMPRVEAMERAVSLTDFPATPNGLCAKYCPVTSCPHNGRR